MKSRNPLKANQVDIKQGTPQELEEGVDQEGKKWSARDLSGLKPRPLVAVYNIGIKTITTSLRIDWDSEVYNNIGTTLVGGNIFIKLHEAGFYEVTVIGQLSASQDVNLILSVGNNRLGGDKVHGEGAFNLFSGVVELPADSSVDVQILTPSSPPQIPVNFERARISIRKL